MLLLGGCCRGPTTATERHPGDRATASPPPAVGPLDELASPAPLPDEQIEAEVRRLVASIPLETVPAEPAVGAEGTLLVEPDPERAPVPIEAFDRIIGQSQPRGVSGKLLQMHSRLLRRAVGVTVGSSGEATLRFETLRPLAGASLFYGAPAPDDLLGLPRYRKVVSALERDDGATRHRLGFDLRALTAARHDIGGVSRRGRGECTWRLELHGADGPATEPADGRLSFRCPPPCVEAAGFVQLPSVPVGPFVDRVGPTSAVVSWTTDAATAGFVLVHGGAGPLVPFPSATTGTRHEVGLAGLEPDRRYRYQVLSVDRRGEWSLGRGATFRTAPRTGDRRAHFRFVVLSDSRSGDGPGDERYLGSDKRVLEALMLVALSRQPRFLLFAGDLVRGGGTEPGSFRYELEAWQRLTAPVGAHVPIYEQMGNHESLFQLWQEGWALDRPDGADAESVFAELFVNPGNGPERARPEAPPYRENVYSFDHGQAHVAVVNSNYWYRSHPDRADHPAGTRGQRPGSVDDAQLAWLDRDLGDARARGQEHLFVSTHEPAFPTGGHLGDAMYHGGRVPAVLAQRDRLLTILGRHRVAVLFAGHEHNYSRLAIDGSLVPAMAGRVWQVVTGGAGAPYHARDGACPWAAKVEAFTAQQHLVVVEVRGASLALEAVGITGQTIDRLAL